MILDLVDKCIYLTFSAAVIFCFYENNIRIVIKLSLDGYGALVSSYTIANCLWFSKIELTQLLRRYSVGKWIHFYTANYRP